MTEAGMAGKARGRGLQTPAGTAPAAAAVARGAHAARQLGGRVRGGNCPWDKLVHEWDEKKKVDIKVDFITSNGDKDLLTAAAEAQAKTGHDIIQLTAWYAPGYAESLEPVDD